MKTLYFFIIICLVSITAGYSQSNKMSTKKSSVDMKISSVSTKGKDQKVKKTYKANKYHNSAKHFDKVSDVTTDKSLKNASAIKKANASNSSKYKKSQAEHLNNLNSQNKYKNGKKNTGFFYLY